MSKRVMFIFKTACKYLIWLRLFCALMALFLAFSVLVAGTSPLMARTVKDHLGRKIKIPEKPERILSLAPSITECLFALEQGDRVIGVTQFSDYPTEAKKLPQVGSYVNLNLEKIVALKPDLCIGTKDGNPRSVIMRLEKLGVPVYAVDPRDLFAVMDTLSELGDLLRAEQIAKEVVQDMRERIETVRSAVARTKERPRVFFQIGISPIVSVGTDTFIHELINLAGGKNLTAGSTPYPRISREEVLRLQPEVLIITSMARDEVFERVKKEWLKWPNIPAVKNEQIYLVNSDHFDRATPRLVKGLEKLFQLLHPKLYLKYAK